MRLLFAGTPAVAATALTALLQSRHEVVAVLTRQDAPSGRGLATRPGPVRELAESVGLPILAPADPSDPGLLAAVTELGPDCCPVVAYGGLLPPSLLHVPRHGWVNLHFSLLPAWRGAAPVQWAILSGDDVTGACTFRIGPGLDDGPVYGCLTQAIGPRDTAGDLLDRLSVSGSELLVDTLDAIEDGVARAVPQSSDSVSRARRLTVADARVRWAEPLVAVDRRIRATTPTPGAWTSLAGERVKVFPLLQTTDTGPGSLQPGQVRLHRASAWVGTATDPALLGDVQPQGRRRMSAADWMRGLRVTDLDLDPDLDQDA